MTRNELMEHLYRDGCTLEAIGRLYSLSRERVRQILQERGVDAKPLVAERAKARREIKWNTSKAKRDAKCRKYYGCDYETVLRINEGRNISDAAYPAYSYRQQIAHAAFRGIEWHFTLPSWWQIWQASGRWHQRGRGRDQYCMARKGDTGPYSPANVEIITCAQNSSDSYVTKPGSVRARIARSHAELTERQKEIAVLHANGLSEHDIGRQLGIKPQTVRVHLASIKQKLGMYQRMYVS